MTYPIIIEYSEYTDADRANSRIEKITNETEYKQFMSAAAAYRYIYTVYTRLPHQSH